MQTPDLLVIAAYVIGLAVIGGPYGGKVRTSSDRFAAGMLLRALFASTDRALLAGCGGLMAILATPALLFRPQT